MALLPRYYGCDLVTGQVIAELPDLAPGKLSRVIGEYTSAQASLPLPNQGSHGAPPPDWVAATEQGRTMLVATLDDRPIWGGITLPREGGSAATATLAYATLESYLDRRYVTDHTWTGQDVASVIAAGLIGDANTTEGIGLTVDAPALGTLDDRTYLDTDDKTVYRALSELVDAGLLEWTVELDWSDDTHTAFDKILRVRSRLGVAAPAAGPNAVFAAAAASIFGVPADADARYTYRESYATGDGANHVVAVGDGQGDERPQSSPARDEDLFTAGWPRYEFRFKPASSISDTSVLDTHAQARLALLSRGARSITITARADTYPQLGAHWDLGDDIGFDLISPRHPDGFAGTARAVGWELDPAAGTVSPILVLAATQEGG